MINLILPALSLLTPVVASPICVPTAISYSTCIGYYATIEKVTTNTKYSISEEDADYLRQLGYTIHSVDQTGPSSFHPTYYYWATPEKGHVVSIRQIRNDVDSFLFMLEQLENLAHRVCPVDVYTDIPDNILGYIRSFNQNYTDHASGYLPAFSWAHTAGNVSVNFNQLIEDNDDSNGLSFSQFFGSFVSSSAYCTQGGYHVPFVPISGISNALSLIDPCEHYQHSQGSSSYSGNDMIGIDLVHMFASLDTLYFTDSIMGGYATASSRLSVITSWGGDLQTEAKSTSLTPENSLSFFNTLSSQNSNNGGCMRYDDFTADLDATNVARQNFIFPSHSRNYSILSAAFANYYAVDHVVSHTYRYTLFIELTVENRWAFQNVTSEVEAFERLAADVMCCSISNGVPSDYPSIAKMDLSYKLLWNDVLALSGPSLNLRANLSVGFSAFVIEKAGLTPISL